MTESKVRQKHCVNSSWASCRSSARLHLAGGWRRITFIVTSGDRFMQAAEINDLFRREDPAGRLYVRLLSLLIKHE